MAVLNQSILLIVCESVHNFLTLEFMIKRLSALEVHYQGIDSDPENIQLWS